MVRFYLSAIILLSLVGIACGPKIEEKLTCGSKTYSQSVKTDVAWIALEWNCRPGDWGSGFLVDKERGAFYTNKHVSNTFNSLGRGSHKVFFNGKVYNVEIVKTPPLVDAALIRITDPFNPSEFPEPAKVSTEIVAVGDKLFVEGLHVHPYRVRELDIAEGYDFPLVPIFKEYFHLGTINLDKEMEVVFERLEAKITELDKKISIQGQGTTNAQSARNASNSYVVIRTLKNHKFPFGGLSGTVVRNNKGETVGIFTAGPAEEFDPIAENPDGTVLLEQVYKTAYITPIEAVEELRKYIR